MIIQLDLELKKKTTKKKIVKNFPNILHHSSTINDQHRMTIISKNKSDHQQQQQQSILLNDNFKTLNLNLNLNLINNNSNNNNDDKDDDNDNRSITSPGDVVDDELSPQDLRLPSDQIVHEIAVATTRPISPVSLFFFFF